MGIDHTHMTSAQFNSLVAALPEDMRSSNERLGQYLGRNEGTVSGYRTGRRDIPVTVANLVTALWFANAYGHMREVLPRLELRNQTNGTQP